jgi:minor histocompatibility antigen H13
MSTTTNALLSLAGLIVVESLVVMGAPVSVDLQYMLLPLFTLTLGCWAAVGATVREKAMTAGEAATLPIWAGVSLVSLYLIFMYVDPSVVNALARLLFSVMGAAAVGGALAPLLAASPLPPSLHKPLFSFKFPALPKWLGFSGEETPIEPSPVDCVGGSIGICVAVWYWFAHGVNAWAANNALGLAFCIAAIPPFNLGSIRVGALVLSGLFFYDIFMVFGTGAALGGTRVSIMEEVATRLDAPIKIFFPAPPGSNPRAGGGHSLLGLGDIVVPGFFLALLARFDHRNKAEKSPPAYYFNVGLFAYEAGLALTKVAMTFMDTAQPALLYLVPALLIATALTALIRGEFKELWDFEEDDVAFEKADEKKQK